MKNRVLLQTSVRLVMPDEAKTAIEEHQDLIVDLYDKEKSGCSPRTFLFTVFILANIGMYFLLKNVSPAYVVPKMLLGNILIIVLVFLTLTIILNIALRRKARNIEDDDDFYDDIDEDYVIIGDLQSLKKPKLTLREDDFTYGAGTHEWADIRGYTNSDEWLFVMLGNKSLVPIKMDNLKEKRRMEIIGIFADRTRRAKNIQQSNSDTNV